jgi:Tol biopolymer transport system component/DNA-binding winged helix-turn-helix (wHTH) protein
MSNRINGLYEFGTYRLDVAKRLLTCGGEAVMLAPKTFDLLLLLAESQGRVLTKQELIKALWPDTFVEEANLTFQMSTLRKALGEEGTPWIETVPKHGYRFTAAVTEVPLPAPPEEHAGAGMKRWYAAIAILGIAIALYLAGWRQKGPRADVPGESSGLAVVPLTAYPGFEGNPTLSPDGSQVAFSWNGPNEDNYDIYVKLVGPGEPVRLTTDPAQDERPAWSPDGSLIAFLRRSGANDASLFLIPALGGAVERKLIDLHIVFRVGVPSADLCWTPDGKWLAIGGNFAGGESQGIWLISIENGARRRLTTPPREWTGDFAPAFAPDGRALAFVRVESFAVRDIYVLPLNAGYVPRGEPAQRTFERRSVEGPAWTPAGRELVFSSGGHLGARRLERIGVDSAASGGESGAQLVAVGEQATSLSLSHNGRLVYARETRDSNVWKLELPASGAATPQPVRLISSTFDDYSPDYSPDGGRIAFASTRSGTEEIWVANASGSNPVQLTTMGGPQTCNPRWSPDGRIILFDSRREGSSHLYLMDPSTGSWRRLTDDPANAGEARWSRDGRWIYFSSDRTGRIEIWKMPATGGAPVQLTKFGGVSAYESPDGQWVYYAKGADSPTTIWKVRPSGGEETQVAEGLSYCLNFVVAGKGIYFVAAHGGQGDRTSVDFFDFASGKTMTLHRLDKPWWYGAALSPDQRSVLYSVVDNAGSNLMLVENFR